MKCSMGWDPGKEAIVFVKWPLLVHGAHGSLLSLVSFGGTCAGRGGGGAG